ncbi:CusA/CzcA family heavy metal efflux RND transporter [Blastopirellula sp. JC732]|uniref:CusA/CzcA family heavy metal efflux RND transporter n=1 Tax=Blastopirellula sediminis TaxID=2894196 RepID=A0A9X1MJS9_9BACT|nr:CusA/CzcA family heavy metal efflux RND transporter [Blastopirellula sediminis]MCC9607990.1 CusA/CzcA family heavy metal efflux RND transporter [Blastopirellula sediminis]MCC9627217.1 CusA/CzcA family heavy metal efflux RND transporter [Blastopirellula sediminis]
MLTHLIEFSLKNRGLVVILTLLMAGAGIYSAIELPIDAVPDMTNVQVQVVTDAGSLSPVEVERYVTYPVENIMGGLPNVEEVRSVSKFGISVVTIVFQEGTDIYWARNLVAQRLVEATANIPEGYGTPALGPLTTALGEILQFEVRSDRHSPMALRTMLEWEIAPRLREVSGVTEINTHGGYYKTFEVQPDPDRMTSYGITLETLFERLRNNNATSGGGYVIHYGEQRFVRGISLLRDIDDIKAIVIRREANGAPILVGDVANVVIAPMTRQGAVTRDGRGEAVTGLVMMLIGENSREVVMATKERLKEIEKTLPEGVRLEVTYDRAALIGRTLKTVLTNLTEGGLLVVVVLLFMLGSLRAGILVAMAIPLSMLFATNVMATVGVTASLMSLGAIDFGLIVDSSVIMIENCIHRLSHDNGDKLHADVIRDAAIEVRKPTMFGELIISVVFIPILLLQGTEGKLFRPMAMTVLFALAGSLVLSLTFMPAMASLMLPKTMEDKEIFLIRWIKWIYDPIVTRAIRYSGATVAVALSVFLISIPVAMDLGAEFMPRLNEGDLLVEAVRLPSATLEGSIAMSTQIEKLLKEFPEVRTVFCKTGRPEIANDVMGVHQTDVWVLLKPPHDWPDHKTRDELIEEMSEKLNSNVPGVAFGFTQPIEMRVDELVAGVKADVAVLLYGDDLEILAKKGKEIESVLRGIPGAVDVKADYQANLATIAIKTQPEKLARYGVDAQSVLDVVASIGGVPVGEIFEGRAKYPIMVRIPLEWRERLNLLEQLPVAEAGGEPVPLKELAEITLEETPPGIEHEGGRRRTFVSANVRGRDVATFVQEAQRTIGEKVALPTGYEIQWGGDFQNLQSASQRLAIITPIVLLIILLLLHTSLGSVRLALLIFLAVPMAASGGIFALYLREMPFSISAGVGFIALFGVAVLNGLVWVSSAENLRKAGVPIDGISHTTALARLRPVLMTALVASLGFLPMALSTSDGAEMQRPLATVVIGGLITSTLLTSLVVPCIYPWFAKGLPIERDPEANPVA